MIWKIEEGRLVQYNLKGEKTGDTRSVDFITKGRKNPTTKELAKIGLYISFLNGEITEKNIPKGFEEDFNTFKKNEEAVLKESTEENQTLNPYTKYLEEQRSRQEGAELGLLNEQTKAGVQNAQITAQQTMIQQAGLKDQLIEQIKTDRLSKLRAGLTPMQIAQEDLQFMVGNMQGNAQQVQMMNQQKLGAVQQQNMNPYQAYINANAAITGGQGYGNVASGFAATDAGDLYQQALRIAQSKGRTAPINDDILIAQGQKLG